MERDLQVLGSRKRKVRLDDGSFIDESEAEGRSHVTIQHAPKKATQRKPTQQSDLELVTSR